MYRTLRKLISGTVVHCVPTVPAEGAGVGSVGSRGDI